MIYAICIGGLLAALLLYVGRQRAALNKQGLRVQGEIVELKISGLDLLHRCPVVRFQTHTGQCFTVYSAERVDIGAYAKGEKVEVIYLPTDPEQFRIVSEFEILLRLTPLRVPPRLAKGQERRYVSAPKSRRHNR